MQLHDFGENKSKLTDYIKLRRPDEEIPYGTLSAWFNRGTQPTRPYCETLARFFGVPLREVLDAAGYPESEFEPHVATPVPAWLIAAFEPLTPPERRYLEDEVQRTSRELLRLREENATYGEVPPAAPEEPAPPPPARKGPGSPRP